MSTMEKDQIINEIIDLLIKLTEDDAKVIVESPASCSAEMLTIKECVSAVHGVSEHTMRKIVAQGKLKSFRAGEGKRGKILVNKTDLMTYFRNQ